MFCLKSNHLVLKSTKFANFLNYLIHVFVGFKRVYINDLNSPPKLKTNLLLLPPYRKMFLLLKAILKISLFIVIINFSLNFLKKYSPKNL